MVKYFHMHEELWTVRGSSPVLWRIPFYVTWNEKAPEGALFSAVPLLKIQQAAADRVMRENGRRVKGMWMMTRADLRKVGELAKDGTDPETLLVWERPRTAKQPRYRSTKFRERDDFLDALYLLGVGQSQEEVAHWWYLFCNHALDWVINKERPVDMFFAKITPLPFRVNWQEKANKTRLEMLCKRHVFTHGNYLDDWFKRGSPLGLNADGTIHRYLQVELMPFWWKTIKQVERTRLKRLKSERYAEYVATAIDRATPAAKRIFKTWVAQAGAAYALYPISGSKSRPGIVQRPGYAPRPVAIFGTSKKYRDALWSFHRKKFKELQRKSRALLSADGAVPSVPDIQPPIQNVWDAGESCDGAGPG